MANVQLEHFIRPNATFAQRLKYTQAYIVGGENSEPHYRYDYYSRALQEAAVGFETGETLVHVDVGCGPGLFTWVVRDYFRANPQIGLELYGYDHSSNMVELADSIWNHFEEDTHYSCHHSIEDFCSAAKAGGLAPCSVLVTFGYVLVQTIGDQSAVRDFVDIVENVATLGDCRVLAVDARSETNRETFRAACGNLAGALEQRGLIVTYNIPTFGSRMFARIGVGE